MKKLFKNFTITLFSISLLILSGCDDFLERKPLSELTDETFFNTKGDMRVWMAGIYDGLQTALIGGQGAALEWGDLRSDNYGNTGYGDTRVYMNAIDASQAQWNWENLYRVVSGCNTAIARFPNIPNVLPADYNDFLGQAYGLRALMYFYAIRVWKDVPLVTEPWDNEVASAKIPRTSVSEIRLQILSDIDEAINLLSTDVGAPRRYGFNLGAAYALKTDVHMWFKEYDQAIEASQFFIGNANYALVADAEEWKTMFENPVNASLKEPIFTLHWSDDPTLPDGSNQWAQRVGASNTNNTYQISRKIFDEFITRLRSGQGKDGRFWNNIDTLKMSNAGGTIGGEPVPIGFAHYGLNGTTKNIKFSPASTQKDELWIVYHASQSTVKLPIYRLADVLTLRAEALNKTAKGDQALTIINNLRKRVGYNADAFAEVDVNDVDAVENLILTERQLEFMCEGKRWFDLVRTDKVMEVMDPVMRERQEAYKVSITGFGDPGRAYFPIYFKEFEANPALKGTQNPPYTEG